MNEIIYKVTAVPTIIVLRFFHIRYITLLLIKLALKFFPLIRRTLIDQMFQFDIVRSILKKL